mgnify:CR=1 FL=1
MTGQKQSNRAAEQHHDAPHGVVRHSVAGPSQRAGRGLQFLPAPLRVERISGSRALSLFLVELGALIMLASTMVPLAMRRPCAYRYSPTA